MSLGSTLIKKQVLVIGYGGAGSKLAAELAHDKTFDVTVVTPFDYMEVSVVMTKALATGPAEHEAALYPRLKEEGVTYEIGYATKLTNDSVITSTGKELKFDFAVVATGLDSGIYTPDPASEPTMADRKKTIADFQQQIKEARTIAVVGGGPLGTETAADIKVRNKGKRVILIHSHAHVLNQMPTDFTVLADQALKTQGVELILNDRLAGYEDKAVKLASGKRIQGVDLVIYSFAGKPRTSFMPEDALDASGYVKVTDTLQSATMPKIFALGDVSNRDAAKIYPRIEDQMPTLISNLKALAAGTALKVHTKSFPLGQTVGPIAVSFGHDHPETYGVGPNLPGALGFCCWFCPCFGGCCATPAGPASGKFKADFNKSIKAVQGKGITKT